MFNDAPLEGKDDSGMLPVSSSSYDTGMAASLFLQMVRDGTTMPV